MKKLFSYLGSKIRVKLFAAILLVLMVFFAVIMLVSEPLLFSVFTRSTYGRLSEVAEKIDNLVPDSGTYDFDLYAISQNYGTEFELVDGSGFLQYKSSGGGSAIGIEHFPTPGSMDPQYSDMTVSARYGDRKFKYKNFEIKKKNATNADYFIYHDSISTGDTVYVFYPVADIENVVRVAGSVYSVISILVITVLGIIFYIIISRFVKPVEEMNNVTKDMAALNFDRKCNDYGRDEIGELGRSINTLSDKLDTTLDDLNDKNKQLEKDIELRLALDNARKSFISNVSHELKTPIAIISGYAEGLKEGISSDPAITGEYCSIIMDESRKMNELVLELLELSKLESKSQPFTPDFFGLGENIRILLGHLALEIEENGIEVENRVPASLECYAMGEKIDIVLKNYITNAISHCSGEKRISIVSRKMKNGCVRVSVVNTGEHIAAEDIAEIWDSFYRADKAHNRNANRFGLGLSIVKSIMTNHRCRYGVENVGGGVEFYFEVPEGPEYYENNSENN
jgi:signal transduction histidine kinase